ncbi:hypothetical protein ACIBIZ_20115 [Nonomuraea spiralis]|uniref:hypothetical protein n=1 Tax=Nonomuraea TaxID=83681 RepID=UPI000F797F75|nr:hypothetical protein [Nonomuraea sp. WAC 01424]RSM95234.1 hypothetical protein DMB42_49805 [Nonomuraea sp. WAC 01424]
MRHTSTALLAATAAGALALTIAGPASAAPGLVRVASASGQVKTYNNPEAGRCYQGFEGESSITNRTQGTILVFPDPNCQTRVYIPVFAGQTVTDNYPSFRPLD